MRQIGKFGLQLPPTSSSITILFNGSCLLVSGRHPCPEGELPSSKQSVRPLIPVTGLIPPLRPIYTSKVPSSRVIRDCGLLVIGYRPTSAPRPMPGCRLPPLLRIWSFSSHLWELFTQAFFFPLLSEPFPSPQHSIKGNGVAVWERRKRPWPILIAHPPHGTAAPLPGVGNSPGAIGLLGTADPPGVVLPGVGNSPGAVLPGVALPPGVPALPGIGVPLWIPAG